MGRAKRICLTDKQITVTERCKGMDNAHGLPEGSTGVDDARTDRHTQAGYSITRITYTGRYMCEVISDGAAGKLETDWKVSNGGVDDGSMLVQ